ncbi:MAG: CDP-alcohol phosphatidyltransferase family protein [Clostridiales bacterium]|nr:CDP-alcohol phosphatidyltransferase family protein [Clostridiales bacterium]
MLDTYGRKYADRFIEPAAKGFEKLRWKPTHITCLALAVGVAAAAAYAAALPVVLPILLLWISGYFDTVDGALARRTGQTTAIGTLLDIFFDRIVELLFILAFALRSPDSVFGQLLSVCAIVLSMTVFLTSGALLENTGVKSFRYQTGLMERTDGFILFTVMMLLNGYMRYTSFVYAALILFTAVQRLFLTISELRKAEKTKK